MTFLFRKANRKPGKLRPVEKKVETWRCTPIHREYFGKNSLSISKKNRYTFRGHNFAIFSIVSSPVTPASLDPFFIFSQFLNQLPTLVGYFPFWNGIFVQRSKQEAKEVDFPLRKLREDMAIYRYTFVFGNTFIILIYHSLNNISRLRNINVDECLSLKTLHHKVAGLPSRQSEILFNLDGILLHRAFHKYAPFPLPIILI